MGFTDFVTNPLGAVSSVVPGGGTVKKMIPGGGGGGIPGMGGKGGIPGMGGGMPGIGSMPGMSGGLPGMGGGMPGMGGMPGIGGGLPGMSGGMPGMGGGLPGMGNIPGMGGLGGLNPLSMLGGLGGIGGGGGGGGGTATSISKAAAPQLQTRSQGLTAASTAPAGATTRRSAALQSLGDMRQNAANFREGQSSVDRTGRALSNLEAAASGTAPSVAELSAKRQLGETQQAQLGMAARARGAGGALAMRNAMANAQRMGSENILNSQIARAQEMATARGQFAEGAQAERNAAADTALRQLQARQLAAQQYSQQAEGSYKNTMDTALTREKIQADRDAQLRSAMLSAYGGSAGEAGRLFAARSGQRAGIAPAIQAIGNAYGAMSSSSSGLTAADEGQTQTSQQGLSTTRQGLAAGGSPQEVATTQRAATDRDWEARGVDTFGGMTTGGASSLGMGYQEDGALGMLARGTSGGTFDTGDYGDFFGAIGGGLEKGWGKLGDLVWGPKVPTTDIENEYAANVGLRERMLNEYTGRQDIPLPQEELETSSAPLTVQGQSASPSPGPVASASPALPSPAPSPMPTPSGTLAVAPPPGISRGYATSPGQGQVGRGYATSTGQGPVGRGYATSQTGGASRGYATSAEGDTGRGYATSQPPVVDVPPRDYAETGQETGPDGRGYATSEVPAQNGRGYATSEVPAQNSRGFARYLPAGSRMPSPGYGLLRYMRG